MPPDRDFYEALCDFHLLGNDPARALQARRRELSAIAGKGRLAYEMRCRVRVCRLLAQLGEPLADDLAAARAVASKLKDPQPHLDELKRIA